MTTIRLDRIAAFVRVVEAASFTTAARQLGLPKSSISRRVMYLEKELGVRLLQRTSRKLRLTEAGRTYFDHMRPAIETIAKTNQAIMKVADQPQGTVRIAVPPALGLSLLPNIIASFVRRHPSVHIEILHTVRYVDLIEEQLDLAIRIGKLTDSSLIKTKIGVGMNRRGLFASRDYLRRKGTPKTLQELTDHDCVSFSGLPGHRMWRFVSGTRSQNVKVAQTVEVDDMLFVYRAVLAGIGVGLLSLFFAAEPEARRSLVRVLPQYVTRDEPVSLVWPTRRHEPAGVVLFRNYLINNLASFRWNR